MMSAMVMLDSSSGALVSPDGSTRGNGCFLQSEVGLAYWLEADGRCEPMMGHFGVRVAERQQGHVFEFVTLSRGEPQVEREIQVLEVKAIAPWSDQIHEHRDQLHDAIEWKTLH